MSAGAPDIIEFITDPQLVGLSLSEAQEALLRAIYGLPLSDVHLDIFRGCTGRADRPAAGFGEVTVLAGARSGKDSRIAAPIICFEALFGGHERHLGRGEQAVLPLVAQDHRATAIAFGYIRDYVTRSPLLASKATEVLSAEITFDNRMGVYCFPSRQRSLRGWSIPAAVLDELAFFRLEGQADSDAEIQASIRRGMLGFPSPRLVKISTPYMKSGVVFEDFRRAWGTEDPDVLCWRAPSALMNPTLKLQRLERERRLDPDRYAREYEAEFAEDLEAFLPAAWVESAIMRGRYELPPRFGVSYIAAVDPSGGGADSFTVAIVHVEGVGADRRVAQDVMRGWARRDSQGIDLLATVGEIATLLKRYGLRSCIGDRYAGNWVRQAFREAGIRYEEADTDKSPAYLETEPLFAQGRIALLDHAPLARELKNLERRPRAGGRALVDHPHGGHDDHADALCRAAALAIRKRRGGFGMAAGGVAMPTIVAAERPTMAAADHDVQKQF